MRSIPTALIIVALAACGGGGDGGPTEPPAPVLTSITASISQSSLEVGQTATLTATGRDQFGAGIALGATSWSSGAPAVATVNGAVVTGVSAGNAILTVSAGGLSAAVPVTVVRQPPVLASLVLSLAPSAPVGSAAQATVTGRDQYDDAIAVGAVSWSSSVPAVATVSDAGTVTAIAEGTTIVRVEAAGLSASQAFTVTPFTFGNGTRTVPDQVPPGRYRSVNAPSAFCYWERLSGFGGSSAEIIANGIGGGPAVVEVAATDRGFGSSSCATWAVVRGPVTASLSAPFGTGTYIVGVDISPGTWQATEPNANCYWERMANFGGESGSIIANDIGPTPAIVTIEATDAGFSSSRCGAWVRVP